MMYDEKFLKDYVTRIKNIYKNHINSENDFTLVFCLFCGLVSVIDDDTREVVFKSIQFPEYIKNEKSGHKEKSAEIMRHFRNSLCHFKLDYTSFIGNERKQISKIVFRDLDKFECSLTTKELNEFFLLIIDIIQTLRN